ncbi:hypothetical protein ABZ626_36900, partial [Streptomyces longispororuber]|uniref:hypothetical protein n=1 Tax=Streptomyces longispororuber TaxID=68230 RepID=UPI0033D11354
QRPRREGPQLRRREAGREGEVPGPARGRPFQASLLRKEVDAASLRDAAGIRSANSQKTQLQEGYRAEEFSYLTARHIPFLSRDLLSQFRFDSHSVYF